MTDVWTLAEKLETEALEQGLAIGLDCDLTVKANVESLPDTLPSKAPMLELLGGYRYTREVENLTRSECYLYLAHAKKWHKTDFEASETVKYLTDMAQEVGKKFNLSALSTAILRQIILDVYPHSLPTLISKSNKVNSKVSVLVNYRDMQDTLRVVKQFNLCPGSELKLNANTTGMYEQMAQVFGTDWVANWGDICLTVQNYLDITSKTANQLKDYIS